MSAPRLSVGRAQKPYGCLWCVWLEGGGLPFVPTHYSWEASRKEALAAAKAWLLQHGITTTPLIDQGHAARWWSRRTAPPVHRDPVAPEPTRIDTLHSEYLQTLGLASMPESEQQLRWAWREKALQHHPDAGGDASQFIRARNAYEVLRAAVVET